MKISLRLFVLFTVFAAVAGGGLGARCMANPFFYITGTTAPFDTPRLASETSSICSTTHKYGVASCCTADFLEAAEDDLLASLGAVQMVMDWLELAVTHPELVQDVARWHRRSRLAACAISPPARRDPRTIADTVTRHVKASVITHAIEDSIATLSRLWTPRIRPLCQAVLSRLPDLMLGSVCEACRPEIQIGFGSDSDDAIDDAFDSVDDALDSLVLFLDDNNDDLKNITEDVVLERELNIVLWTASRKFADFDLREGLIDEALECFSADMINDNIDEIKRIVRQNIRKWLSKFESDIRTAIETHSLGLARLVLTVLGQVVRQTGYADQNGPRRASEELWHFVWRCGPHLEALLDGKKVAGCRLPGIIAELSDTKRWSERSRRTKYLEKHGGVYDDADLRAGRTGRRHGGPERRVDLYRVPQHGLSGVMPTVALGYAPDGNESASPRQRSTESPLNLHDFLAEPFNPELNSVRSFSLIATLVAILLILLE